MSRKMLLSVLGCILFLKGTTASNNVHLKQSLLVSLLRETSDPDVIPIVDSDDSPLNVSINLSLINIFDVDRDKNEVEVGIWQFTSWTNKALAWDLKDQRFNLNTVNLPAQYLWLPDLTIYNAVTPPEVLSPHVAVLAYDGTVTWVPSLRTRVTCDLQGLESFKEASCSIKFGSWTYNGLFLSLSNSDSGMSLADFVPNPRYEIVKVHSDKKTTYYTCCPEPYEVVMFTFVIKSIY